MFPSSSRWRLLKRLIEKVILSFCSEQPPLSRNIDLTTEHYFRKPQFAFILLIRFKWSCTTLRRETFNYNEGNFPAGIQVKLVSETQLETLPDIRWSKFFYGQSRKSMFLSASKGSQPFSDNVPLQHSGRWACTPTVFQQIGMHPFRISTDEHVP